MAKQTNDLPCEKCGGEGFIAAYTFREGGKCYLCNGTGAKRPSRTKPEPVSAETLRASFIAAFAAAIEPLRAGMPEMMRENFLSRPTPSANVVIGKAVSGLIYREQIQAWLSDSECPPDVRKRAIAAFARAGVTFS